MNELTKNLLYSAGLAASFVLGMWFNSERAPVVPPPPVTTTALASLEPKPVAALPSVALAPVARPEVANAYALLATAPRAAMEEAMKLPDATRLATVQNVLAVWLRNDRLAAAEWMTERRGLREFEPLSAQVSDAFFPDDTEMSAMFSFDLTDEKLRDVRVNRLVAYWKSGAHLKFDNSPWEVDGPGTGPAKTAAAQEAPVADNSAAAETEPKS
jgi:hypothetical protein